ncbi:MAG: leucine/isoleucine/valine transporter permease subunit [Caldilineaceae bacterium]|nr:leucine/isoleucine/valine transporter permease subunit [Caldilineaceae bacterium]
MRTERPFTLVDAAKLGLYGGIAAVLISLVGMVDAFAKKDIIAGVVSMSQVLLGAMAFTPALFAATRALRNGGKGGALAAGAVAGAVAALLVALLALSIAPLNLRAIFVNATPKLVNELLPVGSEGLMGATILVVAGIVVGLLAALLTWLPATLRRSTLISLGAVTLIALLKDVFSVIIPTDVGRFVYKSNGLSVEGAVVLFITILVIAYLWQILQPRLNRAVDRMPESRRRVLSFVATVGLLALLFALPVLLGSYLSEVADLVGFYIVMALGLNVVVGFAGLLDLGYVAFFAIGAYTMAVLTTPELPLVRSFIPQLSFWAALPISVLMALLAGVFLGVPVLKTRGDYLAIITLGFGEIIRLLVLSDALKPVMGGAQGVTGIARPEGFGMRADSPQEFYYLILISILIAWFVTSRLKKSRLGRAWMAIREDEDVAAAMSINLVGYKLAAFATGATLAGLSGAFFGSKLGSMVPASFNVLVSINVLAVLIVGGMGSLPGVVVGAIALIGLPELLREFNEFRWWVYGAVLVMMMLYRPEGLWPDATRERELLEDKEPNVIDEDPTGLAEDATVPT